MIELVLCTTRGSSEVMKGDDTKIVGLMGGGATLSSPWMRVSLIEKA